MSGIYARNAEFMRKNKRTSKTPAFTAGAKLATNIDCDSMYHAAMQSETKHPPSASDANLCNKRIS